MCGSVKWERIRKKYWWLWYDTICSDEMTNKSVFKHHQSAGLVKEFRSMRIIIAAIAIKYYFLYFSWIETFLLNIMKSPSVRFEQHTAIIECRGIILYRVQSNLSRTYGNITSCRTPKLCFTIHRKREYDSCSGTYTCRV